MTDARRAQLEAALAATRARIDDARIAAGRTDPVDLLVVTKTWPVGDVALLAALGERDFGESRDQEAWAKAAQASALGVGSVRWHMIGQLQRNKAASVAHWADVVETVDRPSLVAALGRAARAASRELEVLVQVSLDPEPVAGRGGVPAERALGLAEQVAAEDGLRLRGVMGVAPGGATGARVAGTQVAGTRVAGTQGAGTQVADAAFALLRGVSEQIRTQCPDADRISAGMSGDLEAAIAHGATQVRVGGAILGARGAVQ